MSLFASVEVNLSCITPQYMRVGRIIESYTAFAEGRSKESLIFASNRNLDDARLKHSSKWVFRFRVQTIFNAKIFVLFSV